MDPHMFGSGFCDPEPHFPFVERNDFLASGLACYPGVRDLGNLPSPEEVSCGAILGRPELVIQDAEHFLPLVLVYADKGEGGVVEALIKHAEPRFYIADQSS